MSTRRSPLRAVYDAPDYRSLERADIEFTAYYMEEGEPPVSCKVNDISPMGARLTVDAPADLPDVLRLFVPDLRLRFEAEIRWRGVAEVGVMFLRSERVTEG